MGTGSRGTLLPVCVTYIRSALLQCVAEAAANVLGTTGDVMHELLKANVNVLRFPPSIALKEAARTLLNIWDALQFVDVRINETATVMSH